MKIYQFFRKSYDKPKYPVIGILDFGMLLNIHLKNNRFKSVIYAQEFLQDKEIAIGTWYVNNAQIKDQLPDVQPDDNHWIISKPAKEFLESLNQPNFEFIPSNAGDHQDYFVFNVTTGTDCLDLNNSLIVINENLEVKDCGILTFNFETAQDIPPVFLLPYRPRYLCFVSEEFKQRLEQTDLKLNADFLLTWDSEDPDYFDERFFTRERSDREKKRLQDHILARAKI